MSLLCPNLPTTKSKVETNQPKRILYFEVKVTSFQYSASRLRSLKPRTKYSEGDDVRCLADDISVSSDSLRAATRNSEETSSA